MTVLVIAVVVLYLTSGALLAAGLSILPTEPKMTRGLCVAVVLFWPFVVLIAAISYLFDRSPG